MPTDQIISPEDISKARVVNSISIIAVLFALAAVLLMCSSCTKRMPDEPRVKKCNIQRPVPNWFPPAWHFIDTSKLGTIKH